MPPELEPVLDAKQRAIFEEAWYSAKNTRKSETLRFWYDGTQVPNLPENIDA